MSVSWLSCALCNPNMLTRTGAGKKWEKQRRWEGHSSHKWMERFISVKTRANTFIQREEGLNELLSELNANLDVSWNNMQTPSSTKQCVESKNRLKLLAPFVGSSNSPTAATQNNPKNITAQSSRHCGEAGFPPPRRAVKRERIFHLLCPTRCLMGSPGIFKKARLPKKKNQKKRERDGNI